MGTRLQDSVRFARASVAVFAALTAANCAELSLPSPAAAPGTSLLLPVRFTSQPSAVTGIQFDLQYDSSALSLSATVGATARNSGKTLYLRDLPLVRPRISHRASCRTCRLKRFLIVGLNQNLVVDGTLVNLFASVSSTAPGGTYSLRFLNVVATDSSAHAVTVNAVDGVIAVKGTAGSGPRLQLDGVLNGASLLPGPMAPGEFVTLIGAGIGPASAVLFDGTPAPLLYNAPDQINAIVPYGIYNKASAQVQVIQQGQPVAELRLSVGDSAPAVFTPDGSGVGQGAILNQNYRVNSPAMPAEKGSVIMIFASGAGQTDPPGVDGQIAVDTLPKPLLPVSVQIGGVDAKVLYAGAAPGMVAGVLQVNCIVPLDSPSGYTVPILLSVGKASSQTGVTMAIK
jgi:uncharacterized protein (TIGR03437 family)